MLALVLRGSASSIYVEHSCKLERSLWGLDVWFVTEVIYQLCVSLSRNWQGQSTRNRFKARRIQLVYRWGRFFSNKYMQKEILHRNRKKCAMIHIRIKWSHTEEDTTTKQKTRCFQNTISEKDCRDLCQRKQEGFDRSLPEVKLCRNRPKGQCCSLPGMSPRSPAVVPTSFDLSLTKFSVGRLSEASLHTAAAAAAAAEAYPLYWVGRQFSASRPST